VIDVHAVDYREVEVLLNHRLGDVTGELGVAAHHRHRPGAPALIRRGELLGTADGESGHDIEAEGAGVIVVEEQDDVGLLLGDPTTREVVAGKHRRPVGVLRLAVIERRADRRHV